MSAVSGARERRLVGEPGSDRLVLEPHLEEARDARRARHPTPRDLFLRGSVDEHRRPPDDEEDLVDPVRSNRRPHLAEDDREEILERVGAVVDPGLGERVVGKEGLERLHERAAHVLGEVFRDGGLAGHEAALLGRVVEEAPEDRGIGRRGVERAEDGGPVAAARARARSCWCRSRARSAPRGSSLLPAHSRRMQARSGGAVDWPAFPRRRDAPGPCRYLYS
jgi:hypothetical protein